MEMEFINNILCLPARWLYEPYTVNGVTMPAIMTEKNYNIKCYRNQINVIQRSAPGKPAMVSYESLDLKTKQYIDARVGGNPYKVFKRNIITRYIEQDNAAVSFFANYIKTDGTYLKLDKQIEYVNNARILNLFTYILNNKKSMQFKHVGKTKGEIYEFFVDALRGIQPEELQFDLPLSALRLQRKHELYINNKYESLIHKGHGNQNSARITEDEQTAMLNRLLSDGRNLNNEQIAMLYNIVAEKLEWDSITAATVANYRKKYELLIDGSRKGLTEYRNNHTMQVKRKAPSKAFYYWTADGWEVELLYQRNEMDSKGYSRVTYHNRLTVVIVLDPVCKYPVGYAIGSHETTALITEAYRNAMIHTEEMFGAMYKPLQLQTDNYGHGNLTPMYKAVSDKYTPARVKNAKSKVVEPYFNYLNRKYCQLCTNWSGFGITSKKDSQPNSERLNLIKKDFPDELGCRKQIDAFMTEERRSKHADFIKAYNLLKEEEKQVMNYDMFLYFFGAKTGHKNCLAADGLNVKILGEARTYDCFDLNMRLHRNEQWTIHYNPADLTKVLAVSDDGSKRFLMEEKYIQPMALADRDDVQDAIELKRVNDFNKKLEQNVVEFNKHNYELTEAVLSDERISGTLTKLMLTDSRGQHKDNKNELKAKTERLNAKAEVKELRQAVREFNNEVEEYIDTKFDLNKYI